MTALRGLRAPPLQPRRRRTEASPSSAWWPAAAPWPEGVPAPLHQARVYASVRATAADAEAAAPVCTASVLVVSAAAAQPRPVASHQPESLSAAAVQSEVAAILAARTV